MAEKTSPQISVIMAVYNGQQFLREAMNSILGQTFVDFELIVIDDGSHDDTLAILDSYTDSRIICITNETNIGQTASLNIGIERARGEFIARHDADDVSHPTRFAKQVSFLKEHTAVGLLGTSYRLIDDQGQVLEIERPPTKNSGIQKRLERGNCLCHGSVMMRRDCLDQAGQYRTAFRVTQDYELWLRMAEQCELANLDESLYDFRFHGASVSSNRRGLQLAYQCLALEIATQRRTGQVESAFPEDIINAFPPKTERLLSYARRSAYLFFVAGQIPQAEDAAIQIRSYLHEISVSPAVWQTWMLGRAHALANLRGDADEGSLFIKWFANILPEVIQETTLNQMLGEFYAERAFMGYQEKRQQQVPIHAWQAIRHDRGWLGNWGLLIIAGKSIPTAVLRTKSH